MRVEKVKTIPNLGERKITKRFTQVKVEGEETVEEMLQYGKLCERVI